MKLSELFERARLDYPPRYGDIEIKKIVTDSRKVTEGCLFLCIRGLHADGHGYIDDAIKSGAAVIAAEQVRDVCVGGAAAYIMLDNTRKAAALLYNAFFGNPTEKLKIIGVTGTNGKTSVCHLLAELFSAAGYRCGILGTVCCQKADGRSLAPKINQGLANMTTPDPEELYAMLAELAEDGTDYVMMEVTSHALALQKTDPIRFDTAVFTNLTRDHLDFHGTMDSYFEAKARLFGQSRLSVVNRDDPYGELLLNRIHCAAVTCSVTEGDYSALIEELKSAGQGVRYKLKTKRGERSVALSLPGSFAVINSLMAAAVAAEHGIPLSLIAETLGCSRGAPGRMERVALGESAPFMVLIDYAHTPDALEKLLLSVRSERIGREKKGRILLLFGCGGDRDRSKRKEMGAIGSRLADVLILTSDNSRSEDPQSILRDILKGVDKEKPYVVIPDRRAAITEAVWMAREGDILVLAGKGHETYEINAEGRHPFDERRIVAEAFKKRTSDEMRDA